MRDSASISGYDYGAGGLLRSPVTLDDLDLLKRTVNLQEEDMRYLALAGNVLADETEEIVAGWRAVIGANPHLARFYFSSDGKPDERYKGLVKDRFKQWILDVCHRPLDQAFLDYHHEIGRRHTHLKKNVTDQVAAPPHIPLRFLIAFTAVINDTVRPFLRRQGHSEQDVDGMHRAWCKMVLLHVTLWTRPYVAESDW